MNVASERFYRLVPRGGAGLACDAEGVALGALNLVRARVDAGGVRHCEARSPERIGQALGAAYGPQPEEVVLRLYRGLRRAAGWIEADDLCLAGIEAVLLGFPDLTPGAMAKLADIADLEKGAAWETESRIPAGQTGGGQWTADGGAAATHVRPIGNGSSEGARREQRVLPLDDGVYRPGADKPLLIPTGGAEEEEEPRDGSNGPPPDFTSLLHVFPGLANHPGLAIPLEPIDGFLGISALAEMNDVENTKLLSRELIAQIKAVDPSFVDQELQSIEQMSWQGRTNLLNDLRMRRAVAFYKIRGDAGPLQVETLRFLQNAVDRAYEEGVKEFDAGELDVHLSRNEAIGNYIDPIVRRQLRSLFSRYQVPYGPRGDITINNRDYDTSNKAKITYTVPDARVGNISFDWTLTEKTISTDQIQGFFRADSQIIGAAIIRPGHIYMIPRPAQLKKVIDVTSLCAVHPQEPQRDHGSVSFDDAVFTQIPR